LNAVVFDLELVKRFKKGQLSEIVEIGACKVDLKSNRIVDQMQIYVHPKKGYISKSTRNFINMKKEDMKKAIPYRNAIQQFSHWLGEDYYLCSWGKDDRLHLINQCIRNKMNLDWLKNYNDIQKPIGRILKPTLKNQLGLKEALEITGINPVGIAHRGIDDAINTAELLIRFADQIELQRNTLPIKEILHNYRKAMRTKVRHKQEQKQTSEQQRNG
jgi:sporulation inhibitor KapD